MNPQPLPFSWPSPGDVRTELPRVTREGSLPSFIARHDRLVFADVTFLRVTDALVVAQPDEPTFPGNFRSRLARIQELASALGSVFELLAVANTWACFGSEPGPLRWKLLEMLARVSLRRQWAEGLAEIREVVRATSIEEHGGLFGAISEESDRHPPAHHAGTGADFRGFFEELGGLLALVNGNFRRLDLSPDWEAPAQAAVGGRGRPGRPWVTCSSFHDKLP